MHYHGVIQYALKSGMKQLQYPFCLTAIWHYGNSYDRADLNEKYWQLRYPETLGLHIYVYIIYELCSMMITDSYNLGTQFDINYH